jgi:hypothetical protein
MSDTLVALIIAAGASGITYSKIGRRLGYGNSGKLWMIIALAFVLTFVIMITLLELVLNVH